MNYGDGSGDQTLAIDQLDKQFTLFHTFATPGPQQLTVTISDDDDGMFTDSFLVTVISNQLPTANPDLATTDEDHSVTTSVVANDTDPNPGDVLTVTAAGITSGLGSVTFSGGNVTYNPGTAYNFLSVGQSALVVIGYSITDGHGGKQPVLR